MKNIMGIPFQLRQLGMHPNCHFSIRPSLRNINPDRMDVNDQSKIAPGERERITIRGERPENAEIRRSSPYGQEKVFPHPLAPLLKPFGVTGRTKSSAAKGKHDEPLLPTVGTVDAGKGAARVAAVEVVLDHLLDDRPQLAVLLLEAVLILAQERVQVME